MNWVEKREKEEKKNNNSKIKPSPLSFFNNDYFL